MKYSKTYRPKRWIDVEMCDESHGIDSTQCHRTAVDVLRGRLAGQPNVQMDTHFPYEHQWYVSCPLLLDSLHLSWSRSYSLFLIQTIVWTMLCLSLSKGRYSCGKSVIISRNSANFPVKICLRSLVYLSGKKIYEEQGDPKYGRLRSFKCEYV